MRFPIDGNEFAISNVQFERPHVVLLGAGASRAAFPTGDRNGRKLPVMNDFVDVLELRDELAHFGIENTDRNFELIFQDIVRSDAGSGFQREVERKIFDYFASLELTHEPTLYDLIVLSLRKKDLVATFNWDPFLWAAAYRVSRFVDVPYVAFLHGSVAVGYCEQHPVKGPVGEKCTKCGGIFQPARLFYPIEDKNYSDDKSIKYEWADLQRALEAAYLFTVFGYSAPAADAAAVALLKAAWGDLSSRNLEQTEIIDIRSDEEIVKSWNPFIHTHHYHVFDDYSLSLAATYPRRSCEAFWNATMELQPYNTFEIPKPTSLAELIEWLAPLVEAEREPR